MKATINGITVEGTPGEVWEFLQRTQAQGTNIKPYQQIPDFNGPWWGMYPPDTQVPRINGDGSANTPYWVRYPKTITNNAITGLAIADGHTMEQIENGEHL